MKSFAISSIAFTSISDVSDFFGSSNVVTSPISVDDFLVFSHPQPVSDVIQRAAHRQSATSLLCINFIYIPPFAY